MPFGQLPPLRRRLDGEAQRRAEEQRQRLARFEDERWAASSPPPPYDNYDLGGPTNAAPGKLMARPATPAAPTLISRRAAGSFYGPTGVGKVYPAAATARAIT